jgi:DNA-binding transcriptional MerR regulator
MPSRPEPLESDLYPIGTVAELTGVNSITLRAWERRYGLLAPVRKDSGHRLYSREHIDLITRVVALLDRGMRIGQVKAHLENERRSVSVQSRQPWTRYIERMIAAVVQFDEHALEATYGDALAAFPVQTVTDNLLAPLLEELGRRWESGEGSIAEEHFFGCYLRNLLGARFHHRRRLSAGHILVLACLPGERHETGLLLFALAANDAGYRTVLLGADLPIAELRQAANKVAASGVVIAGVMPISSGTIESLSDLAGQIDCPVFVGGSASVAAADPLRKTGVIALGADVALGLARIDALLAERNGTED